VRRWTLLIAGAALWLFLAAIPALADGGPHVSQANSGTSTLTADNCAGCHRAHTAQARFLLAEEEEALCLSCHGSQGVGATTDVELGIQYKVALDPGSAGQGTGASVVAGALRGGGFVEARISSNNPTRISYPRDSDPGPAVVPVASFSSWVKVAAGGNPVTSAHIDFDPNTTNVVSRGRVWGNGSIDSGAGPAPVSLSCGSCHNPHGNGQYRILNPIPKPTDATTGTTPAFTPVGTGVVVTDDTTGTTNATRNYTVKQASGGTTTLLLSNVSGTPPTDGDYWRRYVPWDGAPTWSGSAIVPATGTSGDRPNGLTNWEVQVSQWCSACHSRYYAPTGSWGVDSGDDIFKYRHGIYRNGTTVSASTECTQCHVSHGSNAAMPGDFSGAYPYPHQPGAVAVTSPSSRLLKVNNRGTCQQCHDPTGTIPYTNVISNPVP
jgi:predicted CXXCH cytochrome family protein